MKRCTVEHLTFSFHKVVRQQNSGAVEDFYITVFRSLSTNPKVKELLKSVYSCQSYRKNKSGTFFMAHGVYKRKSYRHYQLTNTMKL